MKVAVLMGGRSSEREVSLRTGHGIAQSLRQLGHEALSIDAANGRLLPGGDEERAALPAETVRELPATTTAAVATGPALADCEVVFIALHGGEGENGTIQALLELAGKPYTGSGVLASALAMNKHVAKRVLAHEGVPVPRGVLVRAGDDAATIDATALGGWPLVVKPNEEGSTVGLTIVSRPDDLPDALNLAFEYGHEVLVEQFIPGRELTVAVLGDEPLPIVEIQPRSGFYDYASKYTAGASEYTCPADLPEPLATRVRELGRRAAIALGCEGVSRADFRLDPDGGVYCLEVNTIPGMTPTSLVPMAARAAGMTYDDLVARMLELAVSRARRHPHAAAAGHTDPAP